MGNIGWGELLIIGIVIIIFFGADRMVDFSKSIGQASKEFKKGLKGEPESKADKNEMPKSEKEVK